MELRDIKQAVADELARAFETAKRDNGETFTRLKNDAPQWIDDSLADIHGTDMFPDDWRYEKIQSLAFSLAETDPDEWEDFPHGTEIDSLVDIYYSDLTAYIASNVNRLHAANDAAKEYGDESADIETRAGYAQYQEISEIAYRMIEVAESEAESREYDLDLEKEEEE